MPVYSRTITVKEDIESAFTFTADFRNLDKWNEGDEAELITKEPIRSLYPTTCSGEKDKRLRLIRRNDDPQIKINKAKSK